MKNKIFLIVAVLVVGIISCNKDDEVDVPLTYEEQLAKDVDIIDNFLADNNITAETDPSGLRYVIHAPGTGVAPDLSNNVVVAYEGRLLSDGTVFDSSNNLNFPLNRLIKGWQIGLPKIMEGGSITLYIPSGLAYGANSPSADIPANANLIFDIDLFEVQ